MESDVQLVEDRVTQEEMESEDEDVDFNPFLKETLVDSEASSSISSEAEGLDKDVISSHDIDGNAITTTTMTTTTTTTTTPMTNVANEEVCGGDVNNDLVLNLEERREIRFKSDKPRIELDEDEDDAICKRTRARYSLASFTLDELETFLQESDDDDIQNVDEEEEYKKFLAAVLNGGNGDDQGRLEGNDYDDDEDNDADFEIEIEEALESDVDDCIVMPEKVERLERGSRRPETRRNGCKKGSAQLNKSVTQQGKVALRPLLPVASVPYLGSQYPGLESSSEFSSCGQLYGFQAHQIGQLYCLIYEHVQLLVQVYSLCVLDSSRQHIASQIKGLLCELLHKRDLVLAWRNGPYPTSCFLPSNVGPSVSVETKKILPVEGSGVSPNDGQGCRWLPTVGDSVRSVLDVAPIKLVGRYIGDVSNAVREHQRRCVETTNIYLERQPLFALPICPSSEVDGNVSNGDDPSLNTSAVSPNHKVPKKTLAATLVESTKKQSVALVSPQIAKLAQPFYSLFNPELFPYKPPSSAVANRVLFTDAEDVLLAMGIMEYNNDWKSIQQRFLPCKSEHQIFVRAKNRSSSKAPENPIKIVRKMKASPLTEEEKARIEEGLKAFKLDWTSVWRNIVPYRDPNLLPRQWRIAIGTQKSYKADSAKRERHRIYESERRSKATARKYTQMGPEKESESGEDCMDNDNEAFVHEAFLADWRPTSSGQIRSKISAASLKSGCLLGNSPVSRSCAVHNEAGHHENQESQSDKGETREVSAASEDCHLKHYKSLHPCVTSSYPPPMSTSMTFEDSPFQSQRPGKSSISNLVKLAPELPPVKLPPAVRVISQASLRKSQLGSSNQVATASPEIEKSFVDPTVFDCSMNSVRRMHGKNKISNLNSASVPFQKDGLSKDRCLGKERGTDMDPQMHPLLFRTIEEGNIPSYPVDNSMRIPTFSFFPPMQHQTNVTPLRNPCTAGPNNGLESFSLKDTALGSSSLDFHPLLQRAKEFSADSLDAGLTCSILNTDLELSRDQFVEDIVSDAGATASQIATTTRPSSPNADANDLDLDIRLSFASKRRKLSSLEGVKINRTSASVSGTRAVESMGERSGTHCETSQLADIVASKHMETSGPGNSAPMSHKLDDDNGTCSNENVGDHPLLEIVMEQEELSDSDEEIEDVEFEREEMADSDGEEGSDAELVADAHDKEQSHAALGIDSHTQLSQSLPPGASKRTRTQRKGRFPSSGLAGPGKGHTKGSWLSLNSHGSHYKPLSRTKRTESSSETDPIPSHPNGYGKKAVSNSKASSEHKTNISQKDLFSTSSRNSRKHASKNSPPLRADVLAGKSSCTEKD